MAVAATNAGRSAVAGVAVASSRAGVARSICRGVAASVHRSLALRYRRGTFSVLQMLRLTTLTGDAQFLTRSPRGPTRL